MLTLDCLCAGADCRQVPETLEGAGQQSGDQPREGE